MTKTINVARCEKGKHVLIHDRYQEFGELHDAARVETTEDDGRITIRPIILPIKAMDYSPDTAIAPTVFDYTDEEYEAILDEEIAGIEA